MQSRARASLVTVARFISGGVAICRVLPVLWRTSGLLIIVEAESTQVTEVAVSDGQLKYWN